MYFEVYCVNLVDFHFISTDIIDCGFKLKITSQLFTRIILEGSQTLINARRVECQVTSQTNKETRGHFILMVAEKVAAVRTCALAWSVQHFQSWVKACSGTFGELNIQYFVDSDKRAYDSGIFCPNLLACLNLIWCSTIVLLASCMFYKSSSVTTFSFSLIVREHVLYCAMTKWLKIMRLSVLSFGLLNIFSVDVYICYLNWFIAC